MMVSLIVLSRLSILLACWLDSRGGDIVWESDGLPRLGESGSGYGEGLVRELTFTDILFYGQLLICMDVLFYVGF